MYDKSSRHGNNLQGAAPTRPERNDKSPKGRAKKDIMVEIEGQNERLEFRYMKYQSNRKTLRHACVATFENTVITEMNTESQFSPEAMKPTTSTDDSSFTMVFVGVFPHDERNISSSRTYIGTKLLD